MIEWKIFNWGGNNKMKKYQILEIKVDLSSCKKNFI